MKKARDVQEVIVLVRTEVVAGSFAGYLYPVDGKRLVLVNTGECTKNIPIVTAVPEHVTKLTVMSFRDGEI